MDQIIRFCLEVVVSDIQTTDVYAGRHVGQETGINVGSQHRICRTDSLRQPPRDRPMTRSYFKTAPPA